MNVTYGTDNFLQIHTHTHTDLTVRFLPSFEYGVNGRSYGRSIEIISFSPSPFT